MTSIVYHHESKTLAVDGRMCCDGVIELDNYNKIHTNSAGVWVMAGDVSDIEEFVNLKDNESMSGDSANVSGYLVNNGQMFYVCLGDDLKRRMYKNEHNSADGSGRKFALSAMDFGCGAVDAIKYAAKKDIFTGGEIQVVDITTGLITKAE